MSVVIEVKNLKKMYKMYGNEGEKLISVFKKRKYEEFYALNGVSFTIGKGECVGIIGHNGAGKSTLLKILTGVAFPTSGEVIINGKISSLLELGSGFNPELSGMENIYFNGALNGMSTSEIDAVKDEIIEFADIGDFIHQPVKSYSSGMFARLAFAVAINIDPDILIVDEILSVGDVGFQQKCMEKFDEFKRAGKTILYVSHGLTTVQTYCERAIWLEKGKVREIGPAFDVVENYYRTMTEKGEKVEDISAFVELKDVKIKGDKKEFSYGEKIEFELEYEVLRDDIENPGASIEIRKAYKKPGEFRHVDQFICAVNSNVDGFKIPWEKGLNKFSFSIDSLRVADGLYYLDVIFSESQNLVALKTEQAVISFRVNSDKNSQGFVFLKDKWEE